MRQKSEVAGLGVGAVLLCATVAATKVDAFFSSSQRRFSLSPLFFLFIIFYFIHFSFRALQTPVSLGG